ncbi:hypothetical protein PL78_14610 [Yersinia entomophaga]|uniref:Uncharacterized protein n=1 Tax=Yersinia entomophaga TaxID=935293 RepID=A0ABN4PVL0_YERET|nr:MULTISPECIES: hypothetical protein [Yersinia]ANI31052.1 hypothetical protein PL78_14610 [Yersinia entomophaga]OWF88696.1 hypothetical protein B4914_07035 [Yersinia entomophaga]
MSSNFNVKSQAPVYHPAINSDQKNSPINSSESAEGTINSLNLNSLSGLQDGSLKLPNSGVTLVSPQKEIDESVLAGLSKNLNEFMQLYSKNAPHKRYSPNSELQQTQSDYFTNVLAPEFLHKISGALIAREIGVDRVSHFDGFTSDNLMIFIRSMIQRQRMTADESNAKINIFLASLSATMAENAADSTIKEGKQQLIGAIFSFVIGSVMVGAGSGIQLRGLNKQNRMLNAEVEQQQPNIATNKVGDVRQSLNVMDSRGASMNAVGTMKNNKIGTLNEPRERMSSKEIHNHPKDKIQIKAERERPQDLNSSLSTAKPNRHTGRKLEIVGMAISNMATTGGQMVSGINMAEVKTIEANKMIQNTAADITQTILREKERAASSLNDMFKSMQDTINGIIAGQNMTSAKIIRG